MKITIEHIIEQQVSANEVKNQVIIYKGEAFTYFDTGLTRFVFANKDKTKVIKLLISKNNHDFNLEEAQIYKAASVEKKKQMAKTELTYDGSIIEQEFCNPIKIDNRSLTIAQILFAQSCRNEVGWTADGHLVCFDLDEYKKY